MTTKNAILLIVKQGNGIDYNSLLSKFSASYSSVNSARAALSRSLKDLTTFGFLERKGNRFFILKKGEQEIYSEIKNKLVIGLNDSMGQRHPENDIDSIVTRLQVLLQRVREDTDLLKTSKSSLDFSVSDLESLNKKIASRINHMNYISGILSDQVSSMKGLGFNDSRSLPLSNDSIKSLERVFSGSNEREFKAECQSDSCLAMLSKEFNVSPKKGVFPLEKKSIPALAKFIMAREQAFASKLVTVFSSSLRASFFDGKILLTGPHEKVSGFAKKNK